MSTAFRRTAAILTIGLAAQATIVGAQGVRGAPDRGAGEGDGPFETLVIRGGMLIDGAGSPARGPVDIYVRQNRITRISSTPGGGRGELRPIPGANRVIDARGMFVLPGLIDMHTHTGGAGKAPEAEYVYKLWMAHGVTTIRDAGSGASDWLLREKARSARNEIVAPRMFAYGRPGTGEGWTGGAIETPEAAREWVRWAAKKGIDGMKLDSYRPTVMAALLDEAKKHNLGSMAHLSQVGVSQMNGIDAARLGLGSMTHFYGLFESMYETNDIQPFPYDLNYADEQHRFGQVARQWSLVKPKGEKWNALLKEFKALDFTIDPTMVIYSAGRDVMRARTADWHERYTLPSLLDFYEPSRANHGSYWFYWTTADEVAWKNFYRVWMEFLNDYKNMGGRVTVGTDAGFIYQTYGFAYPMEMEMLQEAGFHPLEAIRSGTLHAAEALFKPTGREPDIGTVRVGNLADFAIVAGNPVENLKVLYATGAVKLNDETDKVERVGGVRYTVKDGIVYDAKRLLEDVARMVAAQKAQRTRTDASPRSPR